MDFPNLNFSSILFIIIVELISVIFISQIFLMLIWLKYYFSESKYQLLSKQAYETNIGTSAIKQYRFVVIEYDEQKEIIKETFYKILGDYNTVKYNDEKWLGNDDFFVSNWILLVFPLTGFSLIVLHNIFYFLDLLKLSAINNLLITQLLDYGYLLFFSSMIVFPLKWIIESLFENNE